MATKMVRPQNNQKTGIKTHFKETESYKDTPINTSYNKYGEGMYTSTFGNAYDYLSSSKYDDVKVPDDSEEILTEILQTLKDIKSQLEKLTVTPASNIKENYTQPFYQNQSDGQNQFVSYSQPRQNYTSVNQKTPSKFIPYSQMTPQYSINPMLDQPVEFVDGPNDGMYYGNTMFTMNVPGGYSNESMGDASKPSTVQNKDGLMVNNNYDNMDLEGSWGHYDDDIIVPDN